jgi:hypothetical protein
VTDSPLPDFNAMTHDEIRAWIAQPGNVVLLWRHAEPADLPDFAASCSPEELELLKQGINPPGTPASPGTLDPPR